MKKEQRVVKKGRRVGIKEVSCDKGAPSCDKESVSCDKRALSCDKGSEL